ncbi:hypothetical protein [Streptomyces sp. NBC_00696]|uniref:hypothetical protein n=1 Tax=Streptomyces sp. NBC_00696 TaxID=2903672 RepID=UPI002E36E0C6|nr:hypothetical protein [Streptomyces sp. NBC_00696]
MSSRHLILDRRLFVLRGFRAGAIAFTSQFMAVFGSTLVGLQFLQLILGYSPLKSALAFLPVATVVLPVSQFPLPAQPPPRPQGRAARRSAVPGRRHALADRV